MSIAESGWDFNSRFHTKDRLYATREFAHLDLNCLLYDMEQKIAEMYKILGKDEEAVIYKTFAVNRLERMQHYMKNPNDGIYYDYNLVHDHFSDVISCASMYPFALGLSDDREAAKNVLAKLELPYGLAACEYRGESADYLQWDYPSMWPSNVYFTCVGLQNVGLYEDAVRVAQKYIHTVDRCFEQTGALGKNIMQKKASFP